LLLFILSFSWLSGQKKFDKAKSNAIESKAQKVNKAFDNKDVPSEAEGYMELGREFESSKEYGKAENYYTKARDLFQLLNDDKNLAIANRALAKMQEMQKNISGAKENYKRSRSAIDSSADKVLYQVNDLDIKRIESSSKQEEESYLQSKVDVLSSDPKENSDELAESYIQLSNTNLLSKDYPQAVKNLNIAKDLTTNDNEKSFEIQQKISNVYVASNQLDKAVQYNQSLLKDPSIIKDPANVIAVKEGIGEIYLKSNKNILALKELESAFDYAMNAGKTFAAQSLVLKLDSLYVKSKAFDKSLALQKRFIESIDELVVKDSSLMSNDIIRLNEDKIEKLEEEKVLTQALINKQRNFIWFSIFVAMVLGGLSYFIYRSLKAIRVKNKKIALQSLRKDMNPHFIFNSLNSVNQFIANNDERAANSYLSKFSTLMRTVLNQSGQDFISLKDELALLSNYLELEKQRFKDKFDYEIQVTEVDTEDIIIPNMILQPHLENAIWHGLRYKETIGLLLLKVFQNDNKIIIEIEDNGIGIEKSKEFKTQHQKAAKSKGRENIEERLALLNDLHKLKMSIDTINKVNNEGTIIRFTFPNNLILANEEV
jgi:chemotaxis protein histidine kinase CheA